MTDTTLAERIRALAEESRAAHCKTCNGWNPISGVRYRGTTGLVCQACGWDYGARGKPSVRHLSTDIAPALADLVEACDEHRADRDACGECAYYWPCPTAAALDALAAALGVAQ